MNEKFNDKLGQKETVLSSEEYNIKYGAVLDTAEHCSCYMGIPAAVPSAIIDIRYASENNFMHKVMYKDTFMDYLLDVGTLKLMKANDNLHKINPDYVFIVFDAARPLRVQSEMFEVVKGTSFEQYVASPKEISMHNFGVAIDLSIWDTRLKKELDMGCEFDTFDERAEPVLEDKLLESGVLTQEQVANRRLLRKVMVDAGFFHINFEWWHFNAMRYADAIKLLDVIQ